jgi:hypothetical protein
MRKGKHVCLSFCLLLCGCFSAVRMVSETPNGGVVVMPNNSNQWPTYYRNRAEYLMSRKCPKGYVIEREETFEDNPALRDGRKPNEDFDYNGAYERITNSARKSYRIAFRRAGPPLTLPSPPSGGEGWGEGEPPAKKKAPPPKELPPIEEAPPPRRLSE